MNGHRSEEELAKRRNDYQQSVLIRRRWRSVGATAVFAVAAVCGCAFRFDFVFFACAALAGLSLLSYFDANGHLREVRRRSTKVLVPDFSLLEKTPDTPAESQPSAPGTVPYNAA